MSCKAWLIERLRIGSLSLLVEGPHVANGEDHSQVRTDNNPQGHGFSAQPAIGILKLARDQQYRRRLLLPLL